MRRWTIWDTDMITEDIAVSWKIAFTWISY